MNRNHLFSSFSEIDDSRLECSEISVKTKYNPIWTPTLAIAVCLCLILGLAAFIFQRRDAKPIQNDTPPQIQEEDTSPLTEYFAKMNIDAKVIQNPVFSSYDIPQATKDHIINYVNNSTVIDGTISKIDSIQIAENDSVWYITVVTFKPGEIIKGNVEGDVKIVYASHTYGKNEVDDIQHPSMEGCYEGMNTVFTLRPIADEKWTICGIEISASDLGDYFSVLRFNRDGNKLVYSFQKNITLDINEINRQN